MYRKFRDGFDGIISDFMEHFLKAFYQEGFQLAQSLNNNKFSEEDILLIAKKYYNIMCLHGNIKGEEYLEQLSQPKLWEVEIEMEECGVVYSGGLRMVGELGGKGIQPHYLFKPKITQEGIKILKLK